MAAFIGKALAGLGLVAVANPAATAVVANAAAGAVCGIAAGCAAGGTAAGGATAGIAAASAVSSIATVGAVGGITAAIFTNNRHTIIINQTDEAIHVMVDGEEMKIGAEKEWNFRVKQASPIRIRVRWDNNDGTENGGNDEARVDDNDHRDFIVKKDSEGKLELVYAKKSGGKWVPKIY